MMKKNFARFLRVGGTWIALIPIIATMVMIFCFSSQNGQTSSHSSDRISEAVIKVFVRNYGDLTPERQTEIQNRVSFFVRKTGHVTEYAVLGFFAMIYTVMIDQRKRIRPEIYKFLMPFIFSFVYAVSDEFHQRFVDGRVGAFTDVLIDGFGVIIGIVISGIISSAVLRKMTEKKSADADLQKSGCVPDEPQI